MLSLPQFILCLALLLPFSSVVAQQASMPKVVSVPLPTSLSFAGEPVPLTDPDIKERLERELTQLCYKHSATLLTLKRAPRWRNKMLEILKAEAVPEDFLYLAAIESEFDPYANSGKAEGFWQLVPRTALAEGLEVDTNRSAPTSSVDARRDVIKSTQAAGQILKRHNTRLKSWTLAALAFNQGMARTQALKNAQKANSYYDLYLSPEPYRYVFRILAMKLIMESPATYGFDVPPSVVYQPWQTRTVEVTQSIENLVDFAREQGISYKTLKYYNPWLVFRPNDYRFEVKPGKSYTIELPVSR